MIIAVTRKRGGGRAYSGHAGRRLESDWWSLQWSHLPGWLAEGRGLVEETFLCVRAGAASLWMGWVGETEVALMVMVWKLAAECFRDGTGSSQSHVRGLERGPAVCVRTGGVVGH